jgi:two-component system sensor histidine kinase YesM
MQAARLDYFADRFSLIVDKFYHNLLNIAVNRKIKEIIMLPLYIDNGNNLENRNFLTTISRDIMFTDNMIQSIIIYSKINDYLLVTSITASNIYFDSLSDLQWLEKASNRKYGDFLTTSSTVSPTAKVDGGKVISMFVTLRSLDQEPQGYISINLDINAIQHQLVQVFQRNLPRSILIIDKNENIIASYGTPITIDKFKRFSTKVEKNRRSGYFIEKQPEGESIISYSVISRYGWSIFADTPLKQIANQNRMITNIVFIIIAIFIMLSIGLAYILSINLLNPLKILFQAMQQIKNGKLAYAIPYTRTDEIGLLYDGFNEMSKNLNTMMEKLYQDELTKKDLQLKMLSYQINTHFLFNTLDVIHWIAQINKVPKISSLVSSLVSYFRIILSEGQDIINLGHVVQLAENYMNIYSIKSEFTVEFIIDIDRSFYEYKTLKYIFQPLLENALNHGIEKKATDGTIRFSCALLPQSGSYDDLLFTISDTGAGIHSEKLKHLQHILAVNDMNATGNFALRNINMQIKIYYGNQYGIKIDSILGKGTKVCVRIPAIREDHHV